MSIFKRSPPSVNHQPDLSEMHRQDLELPTISNEPFIDYIGENASLIDKYATSYSAVGDAMIRFSEDEALKDRVVGVIYKQKTWFEHNGNKSKQLTPEEVADKYVKGVPSLAAYAIKNLMLTSDGSTSITGMAADLNKIFQNIFVGKQDLDDITSIVVQSATSHLYIAEIYDSLRQAESSRRLVATTFSDEISRMPQIVDDADEFYANTITTNGVSEDAEMYFKAKNLRDILASDLLDKTRGAIIPSFNRLEEGQDVLVPLYVNEFDTPGSFNPLINMSKMVVSYANSRGVKGATLIDALSSTRKEWMNVPELNRDFLAFSIRYVKRSRATMNRFTGIDASGRRTGLRMPVTNVDLNLARSAFSKLIVSRDIKEQQKHTNAKIAPNFAFAEQVLDDAMNAGTEPLKVNVSKKTENGTITDDQTGSLDKIITKHASGNPVLADDIKRMIREISINPFIGVGGVPQYIKSGPRTIEGKEYRILKFSPQDRIFSLKSGKEGKRIRIAYSVTDKGVVIHDILHHDDFDRVYK